MSFLTPNSGVLQHKVTWTGVNLSISPFTFKCLINQTDMLINLSSKRKRREWWPISVVLVHVFGVFSFRLLSLIRFGVYAIGSYTLLLFPTYHVFTYDLFIYVYIHIYPFCFFRFGSSRLKVPSRTFNVLVSFVFYLGYFISGYGTILALGTFI